MNRFTSAHQNEKNPQKLVISRQLCGRGQFPAAIFVVVSAKQSGQKIATDTLSILSLSFSLSLSKGLNLSKNLVHIQRQLSKGPSAVMIRIAGAFFSRFFFARRCQFDVAKQQQQQ